MLVDNTSDPEFWTILKSPYSPAKGIEEEIADILSSEIGKAIDQEILNSIVRKLINNGN